MTYAEALLQTRRQAEVTVTMIDLARTLGASVQTETRPPADPRAAPGSHDVVIRFRSPAEADTCLQAVRRALGG